MGFNQIVMSIIGVLRFLSSVLNFRLVGGVCNPDYDISNPENPDSDKLTVSTQRFRPSL